jgi:hypothetical protein
MQGALGLHHPIFFDAINAATVRFLVFYTDPAHRHAVSLRYCC